MTNCNTDVTDSRGGDTSINGIVTRLLTCVTMIFVTNDDFSDSDSDDQSTSDIHNCSSMSMYFVYNNMPLCIIVAVELFPSSVMTQENYQVELDSGMYHLL